MSEIINETPVAENPGTETPGTENPGTETPGTGTAAEPAPPASTSKINLAIEAVLELINAMSNFATMTRGALGTSNGLCCEIAPSNAQEVYLDKNAYLYITLAINGKHDNLQTLSDTLNNIMDTLTRRKEYPTGNGFEIVDITNGTMPRVIGREQNNSWLMACDIVLKIYRKDDES